MKQTNNKLVSSNISLFLNYVEKCRSAYQYCYEQVNLKDKETQDILHKLELDNLHYKERAVLATQLQKIRKERRIMKDEVEELAAFIEWINNNTTAINKLKEVLGETRKQENYHANRVYHPRVNNNEQI